MSVRRIMLLDTLEKTSSGIFDKEEAQVETLWSKVKGRALLLFSDDVEGDFAQYYFAGSPYKIWVPLFLLVVGFLLVVAVEIVNPILKYSILVVGVLTFGGVLFFTIYLRDNIYYLRKREDIMLGCLVMMEAMTIVSVCADKGVGYTIAVFPLCFALLMGWTRFFIALIHTIPFHIIVYALSVALSVFHGEADEASSPYSVLIAHICFLFVSYIKEGHVRRNFKANLKFLHERKKTDNLMGRVLPAHIVPRFVAGQNPIADQYAECTVVCVGLIDPDASEKAPADSVLFMSSAWSALDQCCARYEELVQKVNTAHDNEYIVVCFSNIASDGEKKIMTLGVTSAEVAASWALEVKYTMNNRPGDAKISIGMDTGSARIGLIGSARVSYDFVWGKCLEVARGIKEWAGEDIEISDATYENLKGNSRIVKCVRSHQGDKPGSRNVYNLMGTRYQLPLEVSLTNFKLGGGNQSGYSSKDSRLQTSLGRLQYQESISKKENNSVLKKYETREKLNRITLEFSEKTEKLYTVANHKDSIWYTRAAIFLWGVMYVAQRWWTFSVPQICIRISGSIVFGALLGTSFTKRFVERQEMYVIAAFFYVGVTYILMDLRIAQNIGYGYVPSGYFVFPFFCMALCNIRFKYAVIVTWSVTTGLVIQISINQGSFFDQYLLPYIILLSVIATVAGYHVQKSQRKFYLVTDCVQQEKLRSEQKLSLLLPPRVAYKLKDVTSAVVFQFKPVGMAVAMIPNFHEATAHLTADQTVLLLNEIFSRFDALIFAHNLCRIKTVGSSYVFTQGLSLEGGGIADELSAALLCASKMQDFMRLFDAENRVDLHLAIAIHYGSILTGVIGESKFRVDIWGEDINYTYKLVENCKRRVPICANSIVLSSQALAVVAEDFRFEFDEMQDEVVGLTYYMKKMARVSVVYDDVKSNSVGTTPNNSLVENGSSISIQFQTELEVVSPRIGNSQ